MVYYILSCTDWCRTWSTANWKWYMYDGHGKPSLTWRQCPCASGGNLMPMHMLVCLLMIAIWTLPFTFNQLTTGLTATQYFTDMINPHQTFACPPVSMLTAVKVIDETVNYHCYFLWEKIHRYVHQRKRWYQVNTYDMWQYNVIVSLLQNETKTERPFPLYETPSPFRRNEQMVLERFVTE